MQPTCLNRFDLSLPVTVRECVAEDVPKLEWYGLFTHHRQILEDAWRRHEAGENLMLVADLGGFPVGQTWIDLAWAPAERAGLLWAVRVFPFLQKRGIGRHLLTAAGRALSARGYRAAEIGVETDNPEACRLYERLGFRYARDLTEEYEYVRPQDGVRCRHAVHQWMLRKELGKREE